MSETTRVNGLKATVGTLYTPGCNLFLITVKDAGATAVDLTAEDDDTDKVETVEAIIRELNPLAYFTVNADTGIMYVVMDKAITDADELQIRVRRIGKDLSATTTSIGPNDIDISGSTVTLGTAFTVTSA